MRVAAIHLAAIGALLLVATNANAGESATIPKEALRALRFFVGNWESETFENGKKIGRDADKRRWAPGKHCLIMTSSGEERGAKVVASGLCGWDAKAKQLVEHWYGAQGLYAEIRYPLAGMKKDVWEGTFSVVFGEGKAFDGECELEKTEDGFVWTARWEQEGKELVRKSVARRVRRKKDGG
jgi:hypothetical protein